MRKEKLNEKDETCVVCGHPLSCHIDEGDGWRCHCLGADLSQCECYLRKYRDLLGEVDITYYSLERRVEEMKKELFRSKRTND